MNKTNTFEQFLTSQSVDVHVLDFTFNLFLASALAYVLGKIYVRYGNSISNRLVFSRNLVLLAMTTMFVIAIVKSSLALSLGLVGALSIVRFRAAIKEPEELAYLFIAIAIGLGLGADQRIITLIAVAAIGVTLVLGNIKARSHISGNHLYLTVNSECVEDVTLKNMIDVLNESCVNVDIRRFDESATHLEASFRAELNSIESLDSLKSKLRRLDKNIRITFLDQGGIAE